MGNTKKYMMKKIVTALDTVLKAEANSTACVFMHQPKAPKELDKFKKHK